MNNYDNHIQFAKDVISRSQLPKHHRRNLDRLIQRIDERQKDPYLYLAVIGEFSSGKSTFINALLRDNLLKTSALVTTAAATRLRYGNQLKVEVNFANVPEIFQKITNNITLPKKGLNKLLVTWLVIIAISYIALPVVVTVLIFAVFLIILIVFFFDTQNNKKNRQNNQKKIVTSDDIKDNSLDNKQFIHKVTSEEEIAKEIIDINIRHPSNFLEDNIVIIDLPGTNASNTRHAQVTRKVVEKEADVAIIMIPATQPLTESLVEFLTTTISSYLHRCIFVVSRMDQIRQKEHKRMLNYIRNGLVDKLKISPDKLYACSAQAVVDNFIEEEQTVKNPQFWIDEFERMQVEIVERLHSERNTIISENIQNLFGKLFQEIKKFLQEQWNGYREKEAQIQRETIQDLELFKNQQYRECIGMIDRATNRTESRINDHIDSYRDRTITTVKNAIFAASDWDELQNILNNKVAIILQEQQSLLSKSIKSECQNLSRSAQEVGRHFDNKFMEVYQSLQALGGGVQHSSVFSSSSISVNTDSITASARELNSSNFGNAIAGLFSYLFRGLLEDRKQKIWGEVRPKLYNSFSEIKKQVQLTVKKDADNLKIAINQRITAYITHYKSVVDAMLNKQKMELQRLTQLQATIQADLAEIERRRLQITVNL